MSTYYTVRTILNRELEAEYVKFFAQYKIKNPLIMLANGTATKSALDYLGIKNNQKVIIDAVVHSSILPSLFSGLVSRMGINVPGTGIAMALPVESVAGKSSLKYLTEGQEISSTEDIRMKDTAYSLLTIICEKGCSDIVMDAARKAGAKGGTVMHAKGTGTEFETKFFGVSISPEKELIYIATKKTAKDTIMRAIMEQAGPQTEARAVVYSQPIEDVVGLAALEADAETEAE